MNQLVKVWDLPVRVFHWLLVVGFTIAYLTEDDLLPVHVWAGYSVFGLLLFRIIWGFVGNRHARFSNFLCSPSTSLNYLRAVLTGQAKRYLGHNPAGAAMIVLLLSALLLTSLTGFAVYGADQAAGPLAAIGSEHEKFWEEFHELCANFTVLLVAIHIAGVVCESVLHKESLVKAMITGNKSLSDAEDLKD